MVMKAYRAVVQQAFEKPDAFLDPLLPFIQDAMDALPAVLDWSSRLVFADPGRA